MEQQIRRARLLSARLVNLYEARRKVGQLIYVNLRGEDQITLHLRKASDELDIRIKQYENEVKCSIELLPEFNGKIHIAPLFISFIDIENGIVDISKKCDASELLNLETGEIVGSESTNLK